MSNEINDTTMADIEASITKNLPNQVGKVLQGQLKQFEELKKDHEALKEKNEQAWERFEEQVAAKNTLEMQLGIVTKEYKDYKDYNDALDEREKELREREITVEVFELKAQLGAQETQNLQQNCFLNNLTKQYGSMKTTTTESNGMEPNRMGHTPPDANGFQQYSADTVNTHKSETITVKEELT